ncbi:hypothetical protein ACTWP5_23100 [Streptomyces sp. 4N509B]|uniref:hypothetical protein n=1 Tax=Streptomyces sp. 4N509B TaxID=3457413 RepID=UPI003FD0A44F
MRAADRGATRIAERVVAKLAAQAAREALRDAPAARAAPPVPHRPDVGPHATAVVRRPPAGDGTGGLASVRVAVELGYPSDIGAQCGAVRRQVTLRLKELADMDTAEVAVDVARLHSAHLDERATGSGRVR